MNIQNLTLVAANVFMSLLFFFTLLILLAGSSYAGSGIDDAVNDCWSPNDQSALFFQPIN